MNVLLSIHCHYSCTIAHGHIKSFLQLVQMLRQIIIFSLLILGLAFYFRPSGKSIKDGIVINSGTGPVKGSILTSRDGREYYAWHRIPFAKPPLGKLRFADPEPVEKWMELIDGRELGPPCAQANSLGMGSGNVHGSEDCLHVNVFIPKELHHDVMDGKKGKLPVMFYIHGGAYVGGSCEMGGPGYFMDEDVIYVTIQYRLEMLGFLTTGDKIARGNQGLKDQTMALKWVNQNIENFGGDPNQVTIFGTSAGGASVHQQTLSPLSKGLFQRAFSQSGAASNTWGLVTLETSLRKTTEIARKLNCPTDDSKELLDCLRNIDLETLILSRLLPLKEEYGLFNPHMYGEGFEPTIEAVNDEKAFIAEHPLKIVAEGKAHRVPWMIGYTTHEGIISSAAFIKDSKSLVKFESEMIPALKTIFAIPNTNVEEIVKQIHGFYFPQGKNFNLDEKIQRYEELLGDAFFNFDIRESARLQRNFSPVYYYLHNKTDAPNMYWFLTEITGEWPMLLEFGWYFLKSFVKENILGIQPPFSGIGHAADMVYYFSMENLGMVISKKDKLYAYSKDLVNLAVQFAKDDTNMEFRGFKIQPTPSQGPITVSEFKNEEVVTSPEPFQDRMDFLRSLKIRPYK